MPVFFVIQEKDYNVDAIKDDNLYNEFLSGDNSAYDKLMIRYGDSLTSYLKGYLYSYEDAEDLMIEAFARIMVKKPRIEPGNFKAYLYKTAHNLVARFYRSDKRKKFFSLEDLDSDSGENEIIPEELSCVGMEEKLLDDEKKKTIRRCLLRIGEDMREALWLYYFEGMSYRETASVMDVSFKKIDNLLTRGRKCLKEEVGKEGIVDAYD